MADTPLTFQFDTPFIERLRGYLHAVRGLTLPDIAKTEYWKYHAGQIRIDISGNSVTLFGKSGYYIPRKEQSRSRGLASRIFTALKQPEKMVGFARRKLHLSDSPIRLLYFFDAFDQVMNETALADPVISPYRIRFADLKRKPGNVGSIEEMHRVYFARDRYELNEHMVRSYYFLNILNGYIDLKQIRNVIEIGAGSGNLTALLFHVLQSGKMTIVDLPETMLLSIIFLHDLFPDARLLMPHESVSGGTDDYDVVFLTPNQTDRIADASIDLAINTDGFQEMSRPQIEAYFDLINRCCRIGGYFFTSNRVEKIPFESEDGGKITVEAPIRFCEYPWNPRNQVLVYEICRLTRLVQLDNLFIRLEKFTPEGQG